MPDPISPYLLDEPPTSTGRALLSRVMTHWCALNYGHSAEEIAAAFDAAGPETPARKEVGVAARLIGELIAAGKMRTYARPIGGGSPEPVPSSAWELDDFRPRMARSAMDPSQPFNPEAQPTHWLFADLEDFNGIVEESCPDLAAARAGTADAKDASSVATNPPEAHGPSRGADERHVRLPELVSRTGMSRSTIYRRIKQGRFPRPLPIDGNIAAWREGDIAAWLADPR